MACIITYNNKKYSQQEFIESANVIAKTARIRKRKEMKQFAIIIMLIGSLWQIQAQRVGLVLSGGGNDVAGSADFLKIINANCSKGLFVISCGTQQSQ